MKLKELFDKQKSFNDKFYDISETSMKDKEEITKSFCLALHAEISDLVSSLNYKQHKDENKEVKLEKIIFESADIFRYVLAILNLWEISCDDFISAFNDKDRYLNMNFDLSNAKWEGQPVIIVDLDDVVIKFREGFLEWLNRELDIAVDYNSNEYYTTKEVIAAGLNPEKVFFDFIRSRGLKDLLPNQKMIETLNHIRDQGIWIHLLTARPDSNTLCLYDTYSWLKNSGLKFDELSFSGEKYRWCANSKYFDSNSIVCAIDDSPKHASEYAKHNINVVVPREPYNTEVESLENVFMFDSPGEAKDQILKLLLKKSS